MTSQISEAFGSGNIKAINTTLAEMAVESAGDVVFTNKLYLVGETSVIYVATGT